MSKSDLYPEFETQSGPPTWDVLKHKQVPIDGMGVMEEPVTSEPMWAQIHINNLTLQVRVVVARNPNQGAWRRLT